MTTGGDMPSRRLAAIMFTDLVGYSALAHRNERLAIELLELHRTWIREILPMHGGIEIETVGDAFLVEFAGALAAVECAIAIHLRFSEHNQSAPEDRRMQLRIGIHLGDVEHKDGKVMGDGVNVASRIHGVAEPGGICVSEQVQQSVKGHGLQFESLGAPALKNIDTRLRLYALSVAPRSRAARMTATLRRKRRLLAALAMTVVLVGIGAGAWRAGLVRSTSTADKSVAVLPFANLSADKSSDYFVDGVHDAIISHLAKVRQLKVVSRTSVMEYRDAARNLKDIGKELGVAHVVEGSVQKAGDRVRVTAQLIRVADDGHLWAETYDRPNADVLAIQSDIAEKVAAGTKVALTGDVKGRIHDLPTANAEAYDLYLQGIAYERSGRFDSDEVYASHTLLNRAIALDPDFALAHAALARLYIDAHSRWWARLQSLFPSGQLLEKGRLAATEALRLAPDLAEAHEAMAQYHYQGHRDYDAALQELKIALRLWPNSPTAQSLVATIRGRQGRWEEAVEGHVRVCELDPLNAESHGAVAADYRFLRRYPEAANYYARAVALAPQNLWFKIDWAYMEVFRTGNTDHLRRTLAEIPDGVEQSDWVAFARSELARYERRYADAARIPLDDGAQSGFGAVTRAHSQLLAGHEAEARRTSIRGLRLTEEVIAREHEADYHYAAAYLIRGIALALLSRRDEAVQSAEHALEILPISRDANSGSRVRWGAAVAFAQAGKHDRAMALLEQLLSNPGLVTAHELRLDPWWQPLWPDPRFQKLVADHMPKDEGT